MKKWMKISIVATLVAAATEVFSLIADWKCKKEEETDDDKRLEEKYGLKAVKNEEE